MACIHGLSTAGRAAAAPREGTQIHTKKAPGCPPVQDVSTNQELPSARSPAAAAASPYGAPPAVGASNGAVAYRPPAPAPAPVPPVRPWRLGV